MGISLSKLLAVQAAVILASSEAACPFARDRSASLPLDHPIIPAITAERHLAAKEYQAALKSLDFDAVKRDIVKMLTDSKDFWPADFGNYGPFLIRQAWHCAGSYRGSDGLGGCDGGRQRFEPERSWDDNTNLDKAKTLLWPIKQKYGLGLSWGDLIILAGTTAIESMGGPVLGFCGGRMDDMDGSASLNLGPTPEQAQNAPCAVNGQCTEPLGTTTVGLIYVNPEGPMGNPVPEASALEVRDTFGRMGMGDAETVALIGGGHAFGKTHGACPAGPGPKPNEDPANPWPGLCGTGRGNDTFTSGFEGAWTPTPTRWSNAYFTRLLDNDWEVYKGPGGHNQWRGVGEKYEPPLMMLTSDISLLHDPAGSYQNFVNLYATDQSAFDDAFAHAWYKLTSRDMGPVARCVGKSVPPAQPFQNPLPPPPAQFADFEKASALLTPLLRGQASELLEPDVTPDGQAYYGAAFIHLAFQAASTFRSTDYLGGANGARIRFSPQADWAGNEGLDAALELLRPLKEWGQDGLSWADLIVFAGQVSLQDAGAAPLRFCPGRTDASDGTGSELLAPTLDLDATTAQLRNRWELQQGLSRRWQVALAGRPRSAAQQRRRGYFGSWRTDVSKHDNTFFTTLLGNSWEPYTLPSGRTQYRVAGSQDNEHSVYMTPTDLAIKFDPELAAIAQEFAESERLFLAEFNSAWAALMTADRFDGPAGNLCSGHQAEHQEAQAQRGEQGKLGACPAGSAVCEYLPGVTECCTAGEQCIANVGCRC